MKIPKTHIENQRKFVEKLEAMKYIHFRDLYVHIDSSNYQTCTRVDFKEIHKGESHKSIQETWGRLKHEGQITNEYRSKTGSEYFIDDKQNVYRFSNHWGAVASCQWTLEGKGQLMMSVFDTGDWQIGVANLQDFKIFRRKDDRRVDILLNPEWVNQIKTVERTAKRLYTLKCNPEFKELPNEDKQFIGRNYGYFSSIAKLINA